MKAGKGKYPFRIGCTSYVKPDNIIPNVEFTGPYVDDIELVLFESPELSNLPSSADINRLRELASEHCLTYSVHFPTTHKAGDGSTDRFKDDLKKVYKLTAPLDPFSWILHLEGLSKRPSEVEVEEWAALCTATMRDLAQYADDMSRVAVENLAYPWRLHEELASEYGASLCLDVGHLWINRPDSWREDAGAMLPDTRVIHLHGLHEGRDHVSLKKSDQARLKAFVSLLKDANYAGLVTLEVFNEQDTEESLDVLAELWCSTSDCRVTACR